MAINIPIVTEFDAKGLQSANNAFSNFKTQVGEADGAMGKFKAGAGAALDTIKANASQFAAAAGAAILGFAVKAIGDFQDLALAADKFANSTGIAVEEASALIEVSGDLGIGSDVVEKAINKLNIAIAKGSKEFGILGVEIARNDKGLIDSNETFIRTVDALSNVQDSTMRARLAAAVFGKGWTDMSEIIKGGAPALRAAIGSVSDAKIINPEEVQRAKELRAAQDALKDALEDVTLSIGKNLVPAMTQLVEAATPLLETLGPLSEAALDGADANASYGEQVQKNNIFMRISLSLSEKVLGFLGLQSKETEKVADATAILNTEYARNYTKTQALRYEGLRLSEAMKQLDDDTNGLIDTWDALLFKFNQEEAWNNLMGKLAEYKNAAVEAFAKRTPEAIAQSEQATRDLVRGIAQITSEAKIAAQTQIKILALIDKGQFDEALAMLQRELARGLQVPIMPVPATAYNPPKPGTSTPGGTIQNPLIPGKINTYNLVGGGQSTPSVVVNVAGSVQTENDLLESIRQGLVNAQRSGKGLIYSNTSTY